MEVLAHGVGSRGDLPIAFWQFAWAAVAALAISFVALGVLWQQPRLATLAEGTLIRALAKPARLVGVVARMASIGLWLLVLVAAFFGVEDVLDNIAPVTIYVIFWVGLQVLAAMFGDIWRVLSPFEAVVSLARVPDREFPARSGWLAPVLMFGFMFLELAHPSGSAPRVLGWSVLLFSVVMLAGGLRWGRAWLRDADPFAVLFRLLGAIAPIGRDSDGQLRFRVPFSGLAHVPVTPAALGVLLVVLGGTSFDGFGESEAWRDLVGRRTGWDDGIVRALGLAFSIALVSALYEFAVRFTAKVTQTSFERARLDFAPSLVPIVFGYTLAHYAQLLVDEVQTFSFLLSDPLGRDWNLLGTADNEVNFDVISVDLIAWIQVLSIVIGHIAAVVVAHDRAVERYQHRAALQSQYAMLFVMVLYSVAGLWLLMNA